MPLFYWGFKGYKIIITMARYSVTIDFPVKRHIKKYLQKKYGKTVMDVSRNDAIGYLVIAMLNRTPDQPVQKIEMDDIYPIRISESKYTKNGLYIGKEQMSLFNKMIDKMFREELYHYIIMSYENCDQKYSYALQDFLNYYGITEDDINSESLLKDFKRRKKQKNIAYAG